MKNQILTKLFVGMFLVVSVISFVGDASAANASAMEAGKKNKLRFAKNGVHLRLTMRHLWEEHVSWTRNFIISALADLEDLKSVEERLLRNQDDIGDVIKPFYGEGPGRQLSVLLRDHIMIAAEVVKAAKEKNTELLVITDRKWIANADSIAAFLSNANPNWNKAGLMDMLHEHLELVKNQVMSRINKDWVADINIYDQGNEHILMLADELTEGIKKQFPENFRNGKNGKNGRK